MPPTGVQLTSRPPRSPRDRRGRLDLRVGLEGGQQPRPARPPPRGAGRRSSAGASRPAAALRRPLACCRRRRARPRAPGTSPSAATSPRPSVRSPRSPPPAEKLSVLTAPASRASPPELVAQRRGGGLVRERDVGAVEAERREAADRRLELGRGDAQRDVDAVEPERLGRRVVHERRARVLDRVADHAGDAGRAPDRHAGCVSWKCWKSANVREKWWRRFLSPGIAT